MKPRYNPPWLASAREKYAALIRELAVARPASRPSTDSDHHTTVHSTSVPCPQCRSEGVGEERSAEVAR